MASLAPIDAPIVDHVRVTRALLSVSDKRDLVPFAKALAARGVELVSTGGTAAALLRRASRSAPSMTSPGSPRCSTAA